MRFSSRLFGAFRKAKMSAAKKRTLHQKRRSLLVEGLENRQLLAVDLNPGDLAVVGYNTGGSPDSFAVVFLRDIDGGTQFFVNDNEIAAANSTAFTDLNEGEASFTVKAGQTITAGTVVVLPWGATAVSTSTYDWTSTGTFGLGNNNEELFFYEASAITSSTFTELLYFTGIGTSSVPIHNSLSLGTTAIKPTGAASRYKTAGAVYTGTPATLLAAIGNTASNWEARTTADPINATDWTFTVQAGTAPEINIQGNSLDILSGDNTPRVADGTDFGSALVGGAAISRTFTIQNTGTGALDLTGTPLVAISGSPDFTISTQPAVDPIAAASSTTFVVTFNPTTSGTQTATVSIANDDSTGSENPYIFDVTGLVNAAAAPEINLQGNSVTILDGDTTPDVADHTAFGSAVISGSGISRTFTIQNLGTGALDLTGTPLVAISGSSDFTITTQPATDPIAAAGSTTFVVTFTPTTLGLQTASISIANDDSDENPYNFDVNGTVVAAVPEVNVQGNSVSIADGDTTPTLSDHTVFTLTAAGSTSTRTYTIQNSGTGNLNLVNGSFASTNPLFTLANIPAGPIAPGGSATFDVLFAPLAVGTFTSTIQFVSDDADEAIYDFVVRGDAKNVSTLVAGDIAFSAFQSDSTPLVGGANGDFFEFVALKDLPAGTSIYFTDSGYRTDLNAFRTNENMLRWVAQSAVAAGSKVSFVAPDGSGSASNAEWTGFDPATGTSTPTAPFGLSTSGDQIAALVNPVFGGTDLLTGTAIAGIQFGAATYPATFTSTTNTNDTALPPGLTDGTTAVSVGNFDNGRYDPTISGSIESGLAATVRESLNKDGNWEVSESPMGTGGTTATFTILNSGFGIAERDGSTTVFENGNPGSAGVLGRTDTFTVVLSVQPTTNVVFNVTSSDIGEATVSATSLTFTPANWDTPQTISVTGVFDNLVDGNQAVNVTVAVDDALSDDAFDPLADQVVSAIVVDTPNRPTVTAIDGVTATPTISFNSVSGATGYTMVVIDISANPAAEVFRDEAIPGGATSYLIPQGAGLVANRTYRAFLFASNGADNYSQSGGLTAPQFVFTQFTVGGAPTSPPAKPVANNVTAGNQPTISWPASTNPSADFYSVYLTNLGTGAVVQSVTGIVSNSFTPSNQLADGRYRIWVSATNAAGNSGFGAPYDFTVGTPIVVPNAPTGISADNNNPPTVSWNASPGATTYNVYMINRATNAVVASINGLASGNFTPSAALAAGSYRIWVSAQNAAGTSAFSAPYDFVVGAPLTIPGVPTGFSATGLTTTTPTISWNAVQNATSYGIWFVNLDTGTLISGAANLTTNSFTPSSPLSFGVKYRILVRAMNSLGTSAFSSPFDFMLDAPAA